MKIAESIIEDSTVVSKLISYHVAVVGWLSLMNMESRCSSKLWCGDGENQCPIPVIPKNIVTIYEIDLFIKMLMGVSKNSVTHQTVKNLVDSFKANKLEK